MGVSHVMRAVCVLASMQVLLVPVGRGICGPGAHNRDVTTGGRIPPSGVTSDPARCLGGRGRRSKVRPWQLMRQTTPVSLYGL